MASPATVSEYGKYIDLQSYDAAAPEASGSLYLSGAAGSELIRMNVGMSAAGNVTAVGSFIIGDADMSEADLEKLDGITNGTVAAGKAVVVDANKDASGFRNVTAEGSFIIGSADMDETDLEKLDGITNGTAAANKALVADANVDISGLRNLDMTGDLTAGTVTMTGFTVDADGDVALKSLAVDDGSTIGCDSDTDLMSLADGALTVNGTLSADTSFTLDSVTLDATELGYLDGVTAGTAAASKALVLDASKNIGSVNQLTASAIKVDTLDVTTINSVTETATTLEVSDKKIVSALSASAASSDGGGFQIGGGADSDGHAAVLWSNGDSALEVQVGGDSIGFFHAGGFDPGQDDSYDLGGVSNEWRNLYLDGVAYIDELRADQLGAALDANSQAITNINVDSGVIDGTVIGGNSAAAGTFTALAATSLDMQGGDVSDAGDVNVDSISAAATDMDFLLSDNSAAALEIKEGTNGYMTFVTTDGEEEIVVGKEMYLQAGAILDDDQSVIFGDDDDASIQFVSADNLLKITGASAGIAMASATLFGEDAGGVDVTFYGASANEKMEYVAADHRLKFTDASSSTWLQLGGDADGEYALDVADGSNQKNKVRAAAFVTYSDERLKTDVAPIEGGLKTVNALRAVNFTWKKDGSKDFGFMAQELKRVVPQAVHGSDEGLYGVDYGRLSAILVSAIQEQSAQIASLKKQLENK